jgi:hypothetical protein
MSPVLKSSLLTFIIVAAAQSVSIAQVSTSKYEIGLQLGTLLYQGDLSKSPFGEYKYLRPSLSIYASRMLDPYFTLRAGLLLGKVGSDENRYSSPEWKQYRAFKFTTSITELSSTIVFNPLGQTSTDYSRRVAPYVFAGLGMTFLNVKRDWSNLNRSFYDDKSDVQAGLAIDSVHSLPAVIPVIPLGAGLRFALNPQLSLNAEGSYRFTATDYLDGFRYSANPKKKDAYYGISVGLSYRFGGYKCPIVSR